MNDQHPVGESEMPKEIERMKVFETLNDVTTKVIDYDKGQFYPLRVSTFQSDFVLDLLLLYEADIYHYVCISDLVKVVCKKREIKLRFYFCICHNYFWLCRDARENYNYHTENCYLNAPSVIQIPSPDKNVHKFSKILATWFFPLVIYFGFESFLLPAAACDAATDQSSTRVIERLEPCGFTSAVDDRHSDVPHFNQVDSSELCMSIFVECCSRSQGTNMNAKN